VSQQGTVAHYRGGSGRPAHTNETVSAVALSTNEVHGGVSGVVCAEHQLSSGIED